MKLLPDGFRPLLAPAAALPALVLTPPLAALPVVVPFVEEAVPVAVDPPLAELPPAELPACANAKLLVSASAAANPIVVSFIIDSIAVADRGQSAGRVYVPITSALRTSPLAARGGPSQAAANVNRRHNTPDRLIWDRLICKLAAAHNSDFRAKLAYHSIGPTSVIDGRHFAEIPR
jgi:hypothetical protein